MIRAKGSFERFNKLLVAGTALIVERMYCGGQFELGLGVRAAYNYYQLLRSDSKHHTVGKKRTLGGRIMLGGARSNSDALNGVCIKSIVTNGFNP
jgi:hypothetical protein